MLLGAGLAVTIILLGRNRLVLFPAGIIASCLCAFYFRRYNLKYKQKALFKYEFLILLPFIFIYTGPLIYAFIEIKNITNVMIYVFILISGWLGYYFAGIDSITKRLYLLVSYLLSFSLLGIFILVPYSMVVWSNLQKPHIEKRIYEFPEQMIDLNGKPVKLFDSKTRLYAIETWSRTCAGCMEEIKELQHRISELSKYNIHLYLINTGDSIADPEKKYPIINRLKKHPQITFLYDRKHFIRDSMLSVEVPSTFVFSSEKSLLDYGYFRYHPVAFNYNFFYRIGQLITKK